jgi:RHS repeat-associated protein
VAGHNCVIELLQPRGQNRHAVFVVKESEAIAYSYERNTEDPRVAHSLNIKIDEYGNPLEKAAVVYARLSADPALPVETQQAQGDVTIIYTQNLYTNDVIDHDQYRLRLPSESKAYELRGVAKAGPYYTLSDFDNILAGAAEVAYHETDAGPPPGSVQKRLIEHTRATFYNPDFTGALPLHQLTAKGLTCESFQLAYTPDLLADIFGARINPDLMLEGGFTHSEGDGDWWVRSGAIQYIDADIGETAADAQSRFYTPVSYTDPFGSKTRVKYDSYCLFIEETEDALGNKSCVDLFNYRTLSPQRMKDANSNISEALTDELGLVKAMAVSGKGDEADDLSGLTEFTAAGEQAWLDDFFNAPSSGELVSAGKNLLRHATARFVYDFDSYQKAGKPAVAISILREEHFQKNSGAPVQISFEYSGGLGQAVLKKVQAEPGPAKIVTVSPDFTYVVSEADTSQTEPKQLRWIGSGRTVLNNKGSAVKNYEPYFSVTHQYEDLPELVENGVTPILYYDPLGRLIKTEMPDGTFSKTEFDTWQQSVYDPNDTVLESAWYHNRINRLIDTELTEAGKDPGREKLAAEQAARHAGTPAVRHFDPLGRPVLSVEHNKHLITDADEFYHTKADLDAEGNLRSVTDARGNLVMQYKYDMLGNRAYQNSMDAGQRWLLGDILGKPLRTWDERGHEFQYFYDLLHRPAQSKVLGGDGDTALGHVFERIFYGEAEPEPELKNLRGKVFRHYDTGGMVETPAYDFKGLPKSTTRKLFKGYRTVADWVDGNLATDLEPGGFTFTTETDALGKVTRQTTPDGSVIILSYNESGLLNGESVDHADPAITATYIKDIDYNEKGQRGKIIYGNDVTTNFYYDKETFRLKRLESRRAGGDPLQDWRYTFDPAGNVTHIEDKNIPAVFFDNQKVTGVSTYAYDALYRLVEATGRESSAALSFNSEDNWNDSPFLHRLNPGDPVALRNYVQSCRYDAAGNILQMRHQAPGGDWTRDYNYQAANNQLISTRIGVNTYAYSHHPRHGFITAMPHLEEIGWNFKEEMVKTIRQRRTGGGTPEATYYQYDGQGQRLRKITENQAGAGMTPAKKDERIYLAGYEIYKKHSGGDAGLERVSLSLTDQRHRFVMIETRNDVVDGTDKYLVRYQLPNHLGSACLELDGTSEARVISYEEYHPFGTTAYQANNTAVRAAAKRYCYTDMEKDEESGLNYHTARYYAPWLGRWVSADPKGLIDGLNIFVYVINNPVNFSDQKGTNRIWQAFARVLMELTLNFGSPDPNVCADPATTEPPRLEYVRKREIEINEIPRNLPPGTRPIPMAPDRLPPGTRPIPMAPDRLPPGTRPIPMAQDRLPPGTRPIPIAMDRLPSGTRPIPMSPRPLPAPPFLSVEDARAIQAAEERGEIYLPNPPRLGTSSNTPQTPPSTPGPGGGTLGPGGGTPTSGGSTPPVSGGGTPPAPAGSGGPPAGTAAVRGTFTRAVTTARSTVNRVADELVPGLAEARLLLELARNVGVRNVVRLAGEAVVDVARCALPVVEAVGGIVEGAATVSIPVPIPGFIVDIWRQQQESAQNPGII